MRYCAHVIETEAGLGNAEIIVMASVEEPGDVPWPYSPSDCIAAFIDMTSEPDVPTIVDMSIGYNSDVEGALREQGWRTLGVPFTVRKGYSIVNVEWERS